MILKSWGSLSSTAFNQNFLQVFLELPKCFCSGIPKSSIPHTTYIYLINISKFSTTGHTVQSCLCWTVAKQFQAQSLRTLLDLLGAEHLIHSFGVSLLKLQVSLTTSLGYSVQLWETWSSLWWKEQREEYSPAWLFCTGKFQQCKIPAQIPTKCQTELCVGCSRLATHCKFQLIHWKYCFIILLHDLIGMASFNGAVL